jgi:hypothetical protein
MLIPAGSGRRLMKERIVVRTEAHKYVEACWVGHGVRSDG